MFDGYTDDARGESDPEDHGEDGKMTNHDLAMYRKVLNTDLVHDMIFDNGEDGGEDSGAIGKNKSSHHCGTPTKIFFCFKLRYRGTIVWAIRALFFSVHCNIKLRANSNYSRRAINDGAPLLPVVDIG